jgi:hypothetical protein
VLVISKNGAEIGRSTGSVESITGDGKDTFVLKPSKPDADSFNVQISVGKIDDIKSAIPLDNGTTLPAPVAGTLYRARLTVNGLSGYTGDIFGFASDNKVIGISRYSYDLERKTHGYYGATIKGNSATLELYNRGNPPANFTGSGTFKFYFTIMGYATDDDKSAYADNVQIINGQGTINSVTELPLNLTVTGLSSFTNGENIMGSAKGTSGTPTLYVGWLYYGTTSPMVIRNDTADKMTLGLFNADGSVYTGSGAFNITFDMYVDGKWQYGYGKADNVSITSGVGTAPFVKN